MMQVSNVNATSNTVQTKEQPDVAVDSVSKDIQSKIMNAQKQRQELSSNTEMSAEEKADIRQKIQQEISDLKRELRQRQAEEKKKQQEAKKAEEAEKEQKKEASREAIKEQQKTQSTQSTDGQQKNTSNSDNGRKVDSQNEEEDTRDVQADVMHKHLSTDTAVMQVRILRNTAARRDGVVRVREAEINQDAARGADVESLKKEQREDIRKETRRMERVQTFMFEGKSRTTEPAVGVKNHFTGGARQKGLYSNNGMVFKTNFESVQMDLRQ